MSPSWWSVRRSHGSLLFPRVSLSVFSPLGLFVGCGDCFRFKLSWGVCSRLCIRVKGPVHGRLFFSTLSNPQRSGIYWAQPSWAVPATRSPTGRPDVVTLLPFGGWEGVGRTWSAPSPTVSYLLPPGPIPASQELNYMENNIRTIEKRPAFYFHPLGNVECLKLSACLHKP